VFHLLSVKLMKTVDVLIPVLISLPVPKDRMSALNVLRIFTAPTDLERPVLLEDKNVLSVLPMLTVLMPTLFVMSEPTIANGVLVLQ